MRKRASTVITLKAYPNKEGTGQGNSIEVHGRYIEIATLVYAFLRNEGVKDPDAHEAVMAGAIRAFKDGGLPILPRHVYVVAVLNILFLILNVFAFLRAILL